MHQHRNHRRTRTHAKSKYSRRGKKDTGVLKDGQSLRTPPITFGVSDVSTAGRHHTRNDFSELIEKINK
jgi:hypothetical protein